MQKLLYNVFTSDIIIDAASATSVAILQQGSKRRRNLGIKLILLYSGDTCTLKCNRNEFLLSRFV